MTRLALFAAALAGVLSAAPSRADVEIAPPPREVRPDGSRPPAPDPGVTAPAENPAETVDRIIKNSKAVGDKLAMTDAGTGTRATQDKILKDIDSLLNPPPQSGGGGGANDKKDQNNQDQNNQDQNKDNSKDGKSSSEGANKEGTKGGTNAEGAGGKDQQANAGGHRPRKGHPNDPGKDPSGGNKKPDEGMAKGQPMGGTAPGPAGQSALAKAGEVGNPTGKMAAVQPKPSVPLDDDVVKEVWGHLPDKLRQQVTQYYKEQFMPRYADLLKQYYSSLASTPQKPGEVRK